MKSAALEQSTSPAEVTNVSPHGFWLFVGERELFVSFRRRLRGRSEHWQASGWLDGEKYIAQMPALLDMMSYGKGRIAKCCSMRSIKPGPSVCPASGRMTRR
jgi:hypothetical protein